MDYAYVEEWQQTRLLLWSIIKTRAGKSWNKKPSDLVPLAVDGNMHKSADELDDDEQDYIKNMFSMFSQPQDPDEQQGKKYDSIEING